MFEIKDFHKNIYLDGNLVVELDKKVSNVDWNRRDDVRTRLRLTVRKILMRYGYPRDVARMEADRVLQQSESLAGVFAGE